MVVLLSTGLAYDVFGILLTKRVFHIDVTRNSINNWFSLEQQSNINLHVIDQTLFENGSFAQKRDVPGKLFSFFLLGALGR